MGPPVHDTSIPKCSRVLRRIIPEWWVQDEETGEYGVTSQAFHDLEGGMSVSLEADLLEADQPVERLLKGYPRCGLAAISVATLLDLGQVVVRRPTEADPFHADVIGKKTKGVRRKLASSCTVLIEPTPY